jgi:hypothetical protein
LIFSICLTFVAAFSLRTMTSGYRGIPYFGLARGARGGQAHSLGAQRDDRIDAYGAPRRGAGGEQGDRHQGSRAGE